jgi:nucleotide-binding universal stress UspA family protein
MSEQNQARQLIVVGVDGSPRSKDALRQAQRLAKVTGCSLKAVMAWQYPMLGLPPIPWDPEEDAEDVLSQTVIDAFGGEVPPDLERAVVQGQPAQVLAEASRGAEMLVVGSRGRGGFTGLLLGSVSSAVAAHAHCPVLITHGEPAEAGSA